jgi:hypothetical protein
MKTCCICYEKSAFPIACKPTNKNPGCKEGYICKKCIKHYTTDTFLCPICRQENITYKPLEITLPTVEVSVKTANISVTTDVRVFCVYLFYCLLSTICIFLVGLAASIILFGQHDLHAGYVFLIGVVVSLLFYCCAVCRAVVRDRRISRNNQISVIPV